MKLLVDMNLSPAWVAYFERAGFEATHWSLVGDPCATDATLMAWARERGFVVFTHDMDFSALLASTDASDPSIFQMRSQDVLPDGVGAEVLATLRAHAEALRSGAVVTLDRLGARVRVLPLRGRRPR